MFKRRLKLDLPSGQSAFLWGARKTGKSTYLHATFPRAVFYDLLKSDLYFELLKKPHLLREEILALPVNVLERPIIIDEVQKIPKLLDEVHWLIENTSAQFILCGSSARKLKHGAANLLGGRAWRFAFYPLVYPEIPQFHLLRALNAGLIPSHYLSHDPKRSLKAYIQDYLTEEIMAEGLTRNLKAFARFLDVMVFSHGELLNFSNIARDCSIDAKTVKEYYQILIDTLLGYSLPPYHKKVKRETIIASHKFYLFDVGVASALSNRVIHTLKGVEAGKAFEHFIFMELIAYNGLHERDFDISFWRTKTGLEVDFILGKGEVAIETKISESVTQSDLKGLIAFCKEHRPSKAILVCQCQRARHVTLDTNIQISILPWKSFLDKLWNGEIF